MNIHSDIASPLCIGAGCYLMILSVSGSKSLLLSACKAFFLSSVLMTNATSLSLLPYEITRNEEDGETVGRVCTKSGFSDFQGPVVVLEIKDKKIKIGEETSNKHLCSTQGSIGTGNTPLICLPNSFMAVIVAENKGGFDN